MIQYLWWDICRHILASPSEPFISSQWPVDDKHTKLPRWEIHCTNTWHLLCTSILLLSCHKALPYPSLIISIFFIFILPSEDLYCCLWFEIETEHSVFSDTRIKMCFFFLTFRICVWHRLTFAHAWQHWQCLTCQLHKLSRGRILSSPVGGSLMIKVYKEDGSHGCLFEATSLSEATTWAHSSKNLQYVNYRTQSCSRA